MEHQVLDGVVKTIKGFKGGTKKFQVVLDLSLRAKRAENSEPPSLFLEPSGGGSFGEIFGRFPVMPLRADPLPWVPNHYVLTPLPWVPSHGVLTPLTWVPNHGVLTPLSCGVPNYGVLTPLPWVPDHGVCTPLPWLPNYGELTPHSLCLREDW